MFKGGQMIPQIIVLGLMFIHIGINTQKDSISFMASVLSQAIMMGLLYWGGFFDVFLQN